LTSVLAAAVIAILIALAGLHVYWGLGGLWPGTTEADLLARVVGLRRGAMPGRGACFAVALAQLSGAYTVAVRQGAPRLGFQEAFWTVGYWGVGLVFLLRGIAAYAPGVFSYAIGTPFYDLNRHYYAPLCLAIAAAMAISYGRSSRAG
jgi:Protein of unknown function (DUF3995)